MVQLIVEQGHHPKNYRILAVHGYFNQRPAAISFRWQSKSQYNRTLRAVHLDKDWLDVVVEGTSMHIEGLQDAVDDVIGPMVNRSVVVRAIRISPKKLKFVDIELAD